MEALRYVRKIESEKIVISDLGQFLGKEVEIIIVPVCGSKAISENKYTGSVT